MDRNAFSQYGWVVISIVVISILIGFASPFGNYIMNSVQSTAETLVNASRNGWGATDEQSITNYSVSDINADDTLFAIGRTSPEYVVAKIDDEAKTMTVFKNGKSSDGIIKDDPFGVMNLVNQYGVEDTFARLPYKNITSLTINNGINRLPILFCPGATQLTDISFSDDINEIGDMAFAYSLGLQELNIPGTIISVGESAFYGSSSLQSVTLDNGVETIGSSAFDECGSITSLKLGNSIVSIGEYSFNDNPINNIVIPESVETIGQSAFCRHHTENIIIPDSVTEVGDLAFRSNYMKTLHIGKSVTQLSYNSYIYEDDVSSSVFSTITVSPENPKFFSVDGMFCERDSEYNIIRFCPSKNNLGNYVIPNSVQAIGAYAFENAQRIDNIVIPGNVKWIESEPFYNSSIVNVTLHIGTNEYYQYYESDFNKRVNNIIIDEGVTEIQAYIDGCQQSVDIAIPSSVTNIVDFSLHGDFEPSQCTVHCPSGSVAETWAQSNGYTVDLTN